MNYPATHYTNGRRLVDYNSDPLWKLYLHLVRPFLCHGVKTSRGICPNAEVWSMLFDCPTHGGNYLGVQ